MMPIGSEKHIASCRQVDYSRLSNLSAVKVEGTAKFQKVA